MLTIRTCLACELGSGHPTAFLASWHAGMTVLHIAHVRGAIFVGIASVSIDLEDTCDVVGGCELLGILQLAAKGELRAIVPLIAQVIRELVGMVLVGLLKVLLQPLVGIDVDAEEGIVVGQVLVAPQDEVLELIHAAIGPIVVEGS